MWKEFSCHELIMSLTHPFPDSKVHGANMGPTSCHELVMWLTHPFPDSKVHGANMGPTWVLSAPGGPHVGPLNLAIRVHPPHQQQCKQVYVYDCATIIRGLQTRSIISNGALILYVIYSMPNIDWAADLRLPNMRYVSIHLWWHGTAELNQWGRKQVWRSQLQRSF